MMKTVTLRIPDDKDYRMLLEFLAKMGIRPESDSESSGVQPDKRRMQAALERMAASGGVSSIKDAAAWEREQREDRPLR
jgi:hypothetical protein